MKHLYGTDKEQLYLIIIQLEQAGEIEYFKTIVLYLLHVSDSFSVDEVKEQLTVEGRKEIMTMAEQLRREGQIESTIRIAKRMIALEKTYVAIFFGNSAFVLIGAIMLGTANGSSYGLAMMFFTLRTKDGIEAAELSGMAQSIGYLLAAVGPVTIGALYDLTNEWLIPFCLLVIMALFILLNGIAAGKNRQVADSTFALNSDK